MKKISIIIPMYNAEKFIAETLSSLLIQKDYIYEIIVIDDGSTDDSAKIIKENYKKEQKIKYFYQDNSGSPSARNYGIKQATGDYVIFFDADDTLIDNALKTYYDILNMSSDIDLIVGNYKKINENSNFLSNIFLFDNDYVISGENIFEHANIDPKPGNKIYSLKIIKDHNLFFDDVKIGQDLNFFLKYLLHINKMYLTSKFIFNYRIVDGSISRTYTTKILRIKDTFEFVEKYYKTENKMCIYDKYITMVELINFYYQYCKVRYFSNKKERKEILKFFRCNFKRIHINKNTILYKKTRSIYIKFIIRLVFGEIFISNIYCEFTKRKSGGNHI